MQVLTTTNDFIGFGTIRGEGGLAPNTDCPDYFGPGWMLYIDGIKFDTYFCRHLFSIPGTVDNKSFFLKYVNDCNGSPRWKAKYDGGFVTCQTINDDSANSLTVGAEVKREQDDPPNQHIDVHFADLEYFYAPFNNWFPWSSVNDYQCDDLGYRLRKIAVDDVWAEEF
jgi:hypothetical protein